jgi:hypothetical protein
MSCEEDIIIHDSHLRQNLGFSESTVNPCQGGRCMAMHIRDWTTCNVKTLKQVPRLAPKVMVPSASLGSYSFKLLLYSIPIIFSSSVIYVQRLVTLYLSACAAHAFKYDGPDYKSLALDTIFPGPWESNIRAPLTKSYVQPCTITRAEREFRAC